MKQFTCIMCPVGCELTVNKQDGKFIVKGNGCVRGERYAISEITAPSRVITSLVKTNDKLISVKTTKPVLKDKIYDVLNEIKNVKINSAKIGDVLIKNVCNLENVDVVVTRE